MHMSIVETYIEYTSRSWEATARDKLRNFVLNEHTIDSYACTTYVLDNYEYWVFVVEYGLLCTPEPQTLHPVESFCW